MVTEPAWPAVDDQIAESARGTALERLIREHQDFSLLRSEEATDQLGLPPWLRVYWHKQHPEFTYRPGDPTGGYPRALKNLYAWMLTHPDLQPDRAEGGAGAAPAPAAVVTEAAAAPTVGTDLRISGAQVTPRSESDIAINSGDTTKIIAGSNAPGASQQAQFVSSDEGPNRLAKLEARHAYGFRNPANQRRRVRIACTRGTRRPPACTASTTRRVTERKHYHG
jgi:hypothetical protein